jgi:predicted nucleic acid-binding protein
MMLVLDANILIRAVLGSRVLSLLRKYADRVEFVAPESAFQETREWLPEPVAPALEALDLTAGLAQAIECDIYSQYEAVARQRIDKRDEDDWPVLAAALAFDCPIWTEDTDFFGCGVATWTTDRVELYLAKVGPGSEH